jgi:uncharacterized membrane protein
MTERLEHPFIMDIAAGAVVVLCWGCTPLMKKQLGNSLGVHEFSLLNHLAVTAVFAVLAVYLLSTGTFNYENYKSLGRKEYAYVALTAVATVISSMCLVYLLKRRDASVVMTFVQPLAIVTSMVLGFFLASEGVNYLKVIGCILVCAGVMCISVKM